MYFHNPGVKQEVIKTKEVTAVHILTQIFEIVHLVHADLICDCCFAASPQM